jgi:hypothetical protein
VITWLACAYLMLAARRGAPERVAAPVDARSPVTVAAGVAG